MLFVVALAVIAGTLGVADPAAAAVIRFDVRNFNASGPGSLGETLLAAWGETPLNDVLVIVPAGGYTLTCQSHDLIAGAFGHRMTILASGGQARIRQDCDGRRVLTVTGGNASVFIAGLTFAEGDTASDGGGIALFAPNKGEPVTLSLVNTRFEHNQAAGDGGGIYSEGPVTLINSFVETSDAGGNGGGIFVNTRQAANARTLNITSSWVNDNGAAGSGGGIFADEAVRIDRSRVFFNESELLGGGILTSQADIVRSTISNNTATFGGGLNADVINTDNSTFTLNNALEGSAIFNFSPEDEPSTLSYTTIAANLSPAGHSVFMTTPVWFLGTVISANGPACFLGPQQDLNSWATDATCGIASVGNARLEPIANNGGPTPTIRPQANSPLVNAIPLDDLDCNGRDQRNVLRPRGDGCDIGSVER